MTRALLTSALVAATAAVAAAQTPAGRATLIKGATVLTITRGDIARGDILIRDGRIAAVGTSLAAPAGATVVDATGKFVSPGIIDAHSHIAIDGSVNEGSLSVTSMVAIQDVIAPDSIAIYRALAGGVTTVNVLHGSANAIGGLNATLKLRWGATAEAMLFAGAPPGIKFALGENPKRAGSTAGPGGQQRYPATRMGVIDVIREAFTDARDYKRQLDAHKASVAAGKKPLVAPRRDLQLEPLVEILEGTRLVHAHCYRSDEILQLLRVADEFGFRIGTFQHALEGYKVADEIAKHGAGASTFSDWWAYKVEAYDAVPYNAALMTERGIVVSINSDSAEEMRHLNQEAAKAVKYGGLTDDQAMRLVTLNPARQLGIEARVGSIDVGKDADLVIWSAHPLSTYAVAETTYVDGNVMFDRAADISRRAASAAEKAALIEKARKATDAPRPADRRPTEMSRPQAPAPGALEGAVR